MARQSRWCRLCWIAWIATIAIMVVSPAGARSPAADGPQQWQSLNAQAREAYQAGDYSKGIALAEKALGLARQTFGDRDPRTLTSLNNMAFLYQAQSRYGEGWLSTCPVWRRDAPSGILPRRLRCQRRARGRPTRLTRSSPLHAI
jgi:hypothetical protein